MKKEEQDILDIGVGFLCGSLMSLGINVEETILSSFIRGIEGFEIVVIIFSVITTIASIYFISKRRGITITFIIFIFSFISGYVVFMSKIPIIIGLGLVPLVITILIVREANT